MECTIATLLACFSWSNLYVDGDIQIRDADGVIYVRDSHALMTESGELIQSASQTRAVTAPARNPYGRIAIGLRVDFDTSIGKLELRLMELGHVSSLDTSEDRGFNYFKPLAFTLFPFR
jgi:hypothetical protein